MERFLLCGTKGAFIAVFDELCAADWSVQCYSPAPASPLRAAIFHSPAGSHIQPSTQLGSELVMCDF